MRELPVEARPDPRTSERGASLVELTVMLVSVVVLLAGALSGAVSHSAQRRVHGEQILAMAACRNTLEQLRGVDFETLPSLHNTGFDVPGTNGQPKGLPPLEGDSDGLPGRIAVQLNRSVSGAVLYTVRTTVTWRGATRGGEFSMECLMGERR
jgi:type II secretory pathway pseudopilin PulG